MVETGCGWEKLGELASSSSDLSVLIERATGSLSQKQRSYVVELRVVHSHRSGSVLDDSEVLVDLALHLEGEAHHLVKMVLDAIVRGETGSLFARSAFVVEGGLDLLRLRDESVKRSQGRKISSRSF